MKNLDADQILGALGLELRGNRYGQWLTFFALGLTVGAVAILLMRPETREGLVSTLKSKLANSRKDRDEVGEQGAPKKTAQASA